MRIAVYTAIAGGVDVLKDPLVQSGDIDYVCFTDNAYTESSIWDIRPLPPVPGFENDPVRRARQPKVLPHQFLAEYDASIWIDGTHLIVDDVSDLSRKVLSRNRMALFRHPEGRPSVRAEAEECIKLAKDDPAIIRRQMNDYAIQRFPDQARPPQSDIIFRRHHDPLVKQTMELWWGEILRRSCRDQLSFCYSCWKTGCSYSMYSRKVQKIYFKHFRHGEHLQDIVVPRQKLSLVKRIRNGLLKRLL